MNNLAIKELDYINNELQAFDDNLDTDKDIVFYKKNKTYYIFIDTIENTNKYKSVKDYYNDNYDKYIYYVGSKEELKGWLYGVVQAKNKRV